MKKPLDNTNFYGIIYRHDNKKCKKFNKNAPLAQLDRVFGYEPKGRGFESLTACQKKRMDLFHPLFLAHHKGTEKLYTKGEAFA